MIPTWGSRTGGGSAPVTGTPAFDTNANSQQVANANSVSTKALPGLTTNQSPDAVLVFVFYEITSGTPSVSSVTSAHLTFTSRGSVVNTSTGAHRMAVECWHAAAAATLSSEVITVNWTGSIDGAAIGACAVSTLASAASPFDPNGGLPGTVFNTTSTTPPTMTFSTTKKDDLLFYAIGSSNGFSTNSHVPAGWSLVFPIGALSNALGANFCYGTVCYESVSTAQSGATVVSLQSNSDISYTSYVDAVTGDS